MTTIAPGCFAFQARSWSAVIESASEQPASRSGSSTVLSGRQDRGGLGHEVDAAEGDHVGVGVGRLARQAERVAHEVGHVLDLGHLVVVRQDHRVALLGERAHLVLRGALIWSGLEGAARRAGDRGSGSSMGFMTASDGFCLMIENRARSGYQGLDSQSETPAGSPTHVTLAVVLQVRGDSLCVLLWQRARQPFSGAWSLPGGYLEPGHALERVDPHASSRARSTWPSCPGSSSSRRSATPTATRTSGSSPPPISASSRSASTPRCPPDTAWHPVDRLPERIAFDHEPIVLAGRERLRAKLSYTNIGFALAPERFSISELIGDLHRRARLPGRPDQPAPRARAPRPARGHRRAPLARPRGRPAGGGLPLRAPASSR